MGLISLPIMLRYGYDRRLASGVIAASGTLAQIIPPSLVLIVMADQLGRSVGDMYAGAFIPGFVLTGLYAGYVLVTTIVRPNAAPALPPEARSLREPDGGSGNTSLLILVAIATAAAVAFGHWFNPEAPTDERLVVSIGVGVGLAFSAAVANRFLGLRLLSRMAERVVFVLIPPLALIFLVLGTIFIGVATPTEGGAMGASGALALALIKRRLSVGLLWQALDTTAKLSSFVIFILIGATVFTLIFRGVNGDLWVEALMTAVPGGALGFLILVNAIIFLLAFFLDYFEIAFIMVPLLTPVAQKLGIDLVWFGVLLAVNMQTSFLHPPFGFALFYLRSVAPRSVKTTDIYRGSEPFFAIQIQMVAVIIGFPGIVTGNISAAPGAIKGSGAEELRRQIEAPRGAAPAGPKEKAPAAGDKGAPPKVEDPGLELERQLKQQ
jgi:TRAP-type mannitol/chloroaromatic compound transport system permease large subunit